MGLALGYLQERYGAVGESCLPFSSVSLELALVTLEWRLSRAEKRLEVDDERDELRRVMGEADRPVVTGERRPPRRFRGLSFLRILLLGICWGPRTLRAIFSPSPLLLLLLLLLLPMLLLLLVSSRWSWRAVARLRLQPRPRPLPVPIRGSELWLGETGLKGESEAGQLTVSPKRRATRSLKGIL